jgi:hypothetical protein
MHTSMQVEARAWLCGSLGPYAHSNVALSPPIRNNRHTHHTSSLVGRGALEINPKPSVHWRQPMHPRMGSPTYHDDEWASGVHVANVGSLPSGSQGQVDWVWLAAYGSTPTMLKYLDASGCLFRSFPFSPSTSTLSSSETARSQALCKLCCLRPFVDIHHRHVP